MAWPMILPLRSIPSKHVIGIYGSGKNKLPDRMRRLFPEAAESYTRDLSTNIIVSDMFRSAESSLWAIRNKRGAKAPGYSGHNYGLSIDLDVGRTMKKLGMSSKKKLDTWMLERNWSCHRLDYKLEFECWHYNFDVLGFLHARDKRTSFALEDKLDSMFGKQWKLTRMEIQDALKGIGLYNGKIDGSIGPISKESIRAFQRTWNLRVDGIAGRKTQRTLAYVTAYIVD